MAGLADLNDAGHFHQWGFLLSLRKSSGLVTVYVKAGKPFAVTIENRRQPMPVLPALVFSKFRSFALRVHSAHSITAPARRIAIMDSGKLRGFCWSIILVFHWTGLKILA